MKKYITMLLIFGLLLGCTACGTSGAESSAAASVEPSSSAPEISSETEAETIQEASNPDSEMTGMDSAETVDMLYYLNLGGGSIMAACYTEEGIAVMGNDYFVVHVGDAEIYNASGVKVTLDELTRGCPIRISWPGMVMESYPGQIAAEKVTAISDTPDPAVPAEDEIPAINGGPKWWVPELQTDLPGLTMEYTTTDFSTAVFLSGLGSWSYVDGEETIETISCGAEVRDWNFDNNTCKRVGFDTVRFLCGTECSGMTVKAYVDGGEEPVEVPVDEDGNITLVDGQKVIYEIICTWDTELYKGEGTYGVKLIVP